MYSNSLDYLSLNESLSRNDVQCREKWSNTLDPSLRTAPFSAQEDHLLESLVAIMGEKNWSKMAQFVPGRTDATIRHRWAALKKQRAPKVPTKDTRKAREPVAKRKALPAKFTRYVL